MPYGRADLSARDVREAHSAERAAARHQGPRVIVVVVMLAVMVASSCRECWLLRSLYMHRLDLLYRLHLPGFGADARPGARLQLPGFEGRAAPDPAGGVEARDEGC